MDLIDQILNQARNFLICPVCNNHYSDSQLKLRGFIDNTYIFQAFCANGHDPLVATYLASLQRLEKPIGAYFHPIMGEKISLKTVSEAEREINQFNGDFNNLWTE